MFRGYNNHVKKITNKIFFIIRAGNNYQPSSLFHYFLPNALHGWNPVPAMHFLSYTAKIYKSLIRRLLFIQPCGPYLNVVIGFKEVLTGCRIYKSSIPGIVVFVAAGNHGTFGHGNAFHDMKAGNNGFIPAFRNRKKGF